jgi:uncharacterized protein
MSGWMEFEWDPNKDRRNQENHGISFEEAVTAFDDDLQIAIPDPDHSIGESQYVTMGLTTSGSLVVVVHAEYEDDRIRIISARGVTTQERRIYEEGQ